MFDYVGLFSSASTGNDKSTCPVYTDFEGKLNTQFAKTPPLYFIACGKTDFVYKGVADFRKLLDDNGYKYEYLETGEGHIWRNWRIYLTEFAPKLFK
jgi:enterochelin esterase family protein